MSFHVRILLLFFWNRISRVPGWLWTYCVAEDHLEHLILLSLYPKCWDYRAIIMPSSYNAGDQTWGLEHAGWALCHLSHIYRVWLVNFLCLEMCMPQGCVDGCSIRFYYALMDIVWLSCGQSVLEDKSELLYPQPPWVLRIFQHGLSKLSLRTEGLCYLYPGLKCSGVFLVPWVWCLWLVGGEGQNYKTLLSRGESQLVPGVGGGAVILVKLLLVASRQLLWESQQNPGRPPAPAVCPLSHGRTRTENVMFPLNTPGNACPNRHEGIVVILRWAGPLLEHGCCEGLTENTFSRFSSSTQNRNDLAMSTWNLFTNLLVLKFCYLVLLLQWRPWIFLKNEKVSLPFPRFASYSLQPRAGHLGVLSPLVSGFYLFLGSSLSG